MDFEYYLKQQAFKNNYVDTTGRAEQLFSMMQSLIIADTFKGESVLCLGARQDHEVNFFRQRGAFAIGLDINPVDCKAVLKGDFHSLPFADNCLNVVFSNSLDHALDPVIVLEEVRRVLKKEGRAYFQCDEGGKKGHYEIYTWKTSKEFDDLFKECGFKKIGSTKHNGQYLGTYKK